MFFSTTLGFDKKLLLKDISLKTVIYSYIFKKTPILTFFIKPQVFFIKHLGFDKKMKNCKEYISFYTLR